MNKRIFIFLLFICCVGTGWWLYNTFFGKSCIVFREYCQSTDCRFLDDLMEESAFWLFHDPDYKSSKEKLLCDIESKVHHHYDSGETDGVDSVYMTLVACTQDGRVVGFVNYYIFDTVQDETQSVIRIGRVHLLSVTKDCRGRGIAERLLKMVFDVFKKENVNKAFLITRPENIRAKKLYHKFGFSEVSKGSQDLYERNGYDLLLKDF